MNTYEAQLLRSLEHALVQQGRLLSAVLSGGPRINPGRAVETLINLNQRTAAWIRVVDGTGSLVADSSVLEGGPAVSGED